MSLSDQALQDYIVKQQAILASYQSGAQNLHNDQQALTRLMLRQAGGLSIIDQGNLLTKVSNQILITNLTDPRISNAFPQSQLVCLILDLNGAKKLRLNFQYWQNSEQPFFDLCTMMGFFAVEKSACPQISDFSILGNTRCTEGVIIQDFSFFTPDLVTTANLVTTEDLVTGDGTITGTLDTASGFVSGNSNSIGAIMWDFSAEVDCANSKFAYLINPLNGASDGFVNVPNSNNFLSTFQLLG